MKSFSVLVVVVVAVSCLMPIIFGEGAKTISSQQQSPKKMRISGSTATRIYRLLHSGGINEGPGFEDEDIFIDDDNAIQKRQYDDYGHMRFGKRQSKGDSDDYGHLRFGK